MTEKVHYEVVGCEWLDGKLVIHRRQEDTGNIYQSRYSPKDAGKIASAVLNRLTEVFDDEP